MRGNQLISYSFTVSILSGMVIGFLLVLFFLTLDLPTVLIRPNEDAFTGYVPIYAIGLSFSLISVPIYFASRNETKKYLLSSKPGQPKFPYLKDIFALGILFLFFVYNFLSVIREYVPLVPEHVYLPVSFALLFLGIIIQFLFVFWVKKVLKSNKDLLLKHAHELSNEGKKEFDKENYEKAIQHFLYAKEYFEEYREIAGSIGRVDENIKSCEENIKVSELGIHKKEIEMHIEIARKEMEKAKRTSDNYDRKQLLLSSKGNLSEAKTKSQKYGLEEFLSTIDYLGKEISEIDGVSEDHLEEMLAKERVEKLDLKKKEIEIHNGKVMKRMVIEDENMACEVFVREKIGISGEFILEDVKGKDVTYLPIGSIEGPIFIKKEK